MSIEQLPAAASPNSLRNETIPNTLTGMPRASTAPTQPGPGARLLGAQAAAAVAITVAAILSGRTL